MNAVMKLNFSNTPIFSEISGHSFEVRYKERRIAKNRQKLLMLLEEYKSYKEKFARNIKFYPKLENISRYDSSNKFPI